MVVQVGQVRVHPHPMLVVLGHVGRGRVVVRMRGVKAACTLVLGMWGIVVMCKDTAI